LSAGNEDNSHYPTDGLTPQQEAQGFARLSAILAEVYPDPATRPKIIGPDADYQDSKPSQAAIYRQWAEEFLGNISQYKVPLFAATLHEYLLRQMFLWSCHLYDPLTCLAQVYRSRIQRNRVDVSRPGRARSHRLVR